MSKVAVIDIGSNSVRMVVFDAMARAPHYLFNEKAMCRLGAGMSTTGHLSPEGVVLAKSALERFVHLARAMRVSELDLIATAAMREASDGPDFIAWVKAELGEDIRILSGEDEARISAQGVLLGWHEANGIVCDMGGSSMELIPISMGEIGQGVTTKLGPLRVQDIGESDREAHIDTVIGGALTGFDQDFGTLYLVGGSFRALAKLDMLRTGYPFPILHEYMMEPGAVDATLEFIQSQEFDDLSARANISAGRLELVPLAAKVLSRLIKAMKPASLAISSYGLREGVLYENMPNWMRAADPLIAAADAMEQTHARFPGYGLKLYEWLAPLRVGNDSGLDRLVLAACLLHDTNWRTHPDFRAQVSFDSLTQANVCGITHEERLFLALALASRYQNNSEHANSHPAIELLPEEQRTSAKELGRALRLGAMISGAVAGLLDHTQLEISEDVLILRIDPNMAAIYGDSVDKRLASLGKLSGRDVRIELNSLKFL